MWMTKGDGYEVYDRQCIDVIFEYWEEEEEKRME